MSYLAHRSPLGWRPESKHYGSLWSALWLAVILATGPIVLGGARTWILLPLYGAVGVLLLLQAARLWLRQPGERVRFGDLIDVVVALFVGYALVRYLQSEVGLAARIEMLNIGMYAAVFWICRYGLLSGNHRLILLATTLLVATGVTVFAYFLWRFPDMRPYGQDLHLHYYPRLCGTYGCPNHYGYLAIVGAVIGVGVFLFSRVSWVWRLTCLYLALLMISGVLLSLSRGSWLALAAAALAVTLLAIRSGSMKWYWPAAGFAVLMVAGVLVVQRSPQLWQRVEMAVRFIDGVEGSISKRDLSSYVRVQLAQDSMKIFKDYPLWGTGPASFDQMHQRYQRYGYKTQAIYTHNDYLNALTDYGLVGAGLIVLFMVLVSWRLLIFSPALCTSGDLVVLAVAWGAWAAILIHSVVDFNMHIPGNALLVFALVGMGLGTTKSLQKRTLWLPLAPLRRLVAVLAIVAALGLMAAAAWTSRAYYPYLRIQEQVDILPYPESTGTLKAAAAMDPHNEQIAESLGHLYRVWAAQARLTRDLERQTELAGEAARWYRTAGEIAPLNDDYMLLRAQVHGQMLRYDEAFLMYQQAIDRRPHNGYYRFLLGRHFLKRGMVDQARAAFQRGVKAPHGKDYNRQMLKAMNLAEKQGVKAEAQAKQAARKRAELLKRQREAAIRAGKPVPEEPPEKPPLYDPVTTP